MRPYRCVKCGEGHKSSECKKKDRTTPAKCALCSCDHPANYKGCEIYKEILARRHKTTMPRAKQPAQSNQTPPSNRTVGNESTGNGNNTHSRSYADATSGKTPNQVNNPIVNWKICCSNKVRKWIS
ncbi:hypothetical protein EVAR_62205_1 [Eumeta japonica]|uniref:Nucleic-acid-binding protein from transposon X-element n=1 Tax=Eumeta variegata TaxID=151549 RepID=A0A4C1ZYQ9_EUMVA|nr:hypothetical protein EVAR_62205_1 [Eumeta japonica]